MPCIIVAIHGILTSQTDPSWPDRFDAWMYRRDPSVKVLKKEYRAGPFPLWNCWVKDPLLAIGLANELELFSTREGGASSAGPFNHLTHLTNLTPPLPPIWFVAHSNGAVIALLATKRLIARGLRVGGLILTGAACNPDIRYNGVLNWRNRGLLGKAIAYSSPDDHVLPEPPDATQGFFRSAWRRLYRALLWPYGNLGRTGWVGKAPSTNIQAPEKFQTPNSKSQDSDIFTRWYRGGHCTYFAPEIVETTFEQIYRDISESQS